MFEKGQKVRDRFGYEWEVASQSNDCQVWLQGHDGWVHPNFLTLLGVYSVAIYLVDRRYGGSEEGGWWYTVGNLQDQGLAGFPPCTMFDSEEAAFNYAQQVNETLNATVNKGRRPLSSVLSAGMYRAEVHEGKPPAYYPSERPHYE